MEQAQYLENVDAFMVPRLFSACRTLNPVAYEAFCVHAETLRNVFWIPAVSRDARDTLNAGPNTGPQTRHQRHWFGVIWHELYNVFLNEARQALVHRSQSKFTAENTARLGDGTLSGCIICTAPIDTECPCNQNISAPHGFCFSCREHARPLCPFSLGHPGRFSD